MINPFRLPFVPIDKLRKLPEIVAIYFVIDSECDILYIGKTTNLRSRWVNHHRHGQLRKFEDVKIYYWEVDRQSLDEIESTFIKRFEPDLNRTRTLNVRINNDTVKKSGHNLNIGSIYLGEHDYDWFIVMSRLDKNSIRSSLSSVVEQYVNSEKCEYMEIINYAAAKNGLSPQETFKRSLKNYPLDQPLKNGQSIDDLSDLGLSEEVIEDVNLRISPDIYEVLVIQARQLNISISELIKERFGM